MNLPSKKMQYLKLMIGNEITVVFVYVNKKPGKLDTQKIGESIQAENETRKKAKLEDGLLIIQCEWIYKHCDIEQTMCKQLYTFCAG